MDLINENQSKGQSTDASSGQFFDFATWLMGLPTDELHDMANKLNKLGVEFDPFSGTKTQEVQELIEVLGLELFLEDPFQFTNIILKRLDDIETELKRRNQ